mmetsp:Transcript_35141/g.60171  ORF Transcript_35141/g.60171 Transcript_35141/m.60171 type:complete len:170 (+) Transcript_35141:27-536(+)
MFRSVPVLFRQSPAVFKNLKTSTGIVGVPVVPDARNILIDLYNRVLEKVKDIHEEHPYRIHTENLHRYRLSVFEKYEDCADIEVELQFDQVELMIHQARRELDIIIPMVVERAAWKNPGWKDRKIPFRIREVGPPVMDLSSFSQEELDATSQREKIVKEQMKEEEARKK